jgi:phenylalanyl-tRNA synthetase beta chain
MKLSVNWLKDYIKIHETDKEIAERLTATGLEVEAVEVFKSQPPADFVVTGKVTKVSSHPDADKLKLTEVDTGDGKIKKIVCGAPNVAEGQIVVVALPGAELKLNDGNKLKIKVSKIRGQESEGMICSEAELGLGSGHAGIMVLDDTTKTGIPAQEVFKPYKDTVLEIGLTPNRGDAASHIGSARDLAAVYGKKLSMPDVTNIKVETGLDEPVKVQLEDSSACIRYSHLLIQNVKVIPSPQWLQNRLKAVGVKPMNLIVDLTNYVMLECGQPLHAFDLNKLGNKQITVAYAKKGEKFKTLDGKERELDGTELMIKDGKQSIAMAGVMGGENSEISDKTTSIFIESACFDASTIRKASKRHQLFTDASFRYERGADVNITIYALRRFASLLFACLPEIEIGTIGDLYPKPVSPAKVDLRYEQLNSLAGQVIPHKDVTKILSGLDFEILESDDMGLLLEVPTCKTDVTRPVDVIEEILRIYSYNRIEPDGHIRTVMQESSDIWKEDRKNRISSYLCHNGFHEILSSSLVNSDKYQHLHGWAKHIKMINALSKDLDVMRHSITGSGLAAIIHNINRQQQNLKLFEYGRAYTKGPAHTYHEQEHIGIWMTGLTAVDNWHSAERKLDFFDLKAYLINILKVCGLAYGETQSIENDKDFAFGLSLDLNGWHLAEFGMLSPALVREWGIKQPVFHARLNADALLSVSEGAQQISYMEIPRFPTVRRDLSLVISGNVSFEEIKMLILKEGGKLIQDVSVFDVYEGEQLKKGERSYAIKLLINDASRTLKDKQIDQLMKNVVDLLEAKLKIKVRQ